LEKRTRRSYETLIWLPVLPDKMDSASKRGKKDAEEQHALYEEMIEEARREGKKVTQHLRSILWDKALVEHCNNTSAEELPELDGNRRRSTRNCWRLN
jgi:hypothetical protein